MSKKNRSQIPPVNASHREKAPTGLPYGTIAISEATLEPWPNPAPGEVYETHISFPEFTCLCPRSGYPDFATISIRYRPVELIVELKSLKLYLNGYRDRAISHEAATATIYRDLFDLLTPGFLEVVGDFSVRGNVKTVITLNSRMEKEPESSPKNRKREEKSGKDR